MLKFLLKRILSLIPVVIIISIVLFFLVTSMPGSIEDVYCNPMNFTKRPKELNKCREVVIQDLSLDEHIVVQYVKWFNKMFIEFDLGDSVVYKRPVVEVVDTFIQNSIQLNIFVLIVSFLISIPVGIISAMKKRSLFDNFWQVFSLFGISMPSFFLSIILIYIFAIKLGWLPLSGKGKPGFEYPSEFAEFMDSLKYMVLPSLILIIGSLAGTIRYVRNAMLEVLDQDYIRTARAKGLSERVVIYSHAFRNALIPVVTLLAFAIPAIFGGSAIIESIFLWPGIGRVLLQSLHQRDYALVLAMNMFYAVLALFANILMDIGYALVDPRVKFE